MNAPSEDSSDWNTLREKVIGLGERSTQKSYYPELQQRLAQLERFRALLDQANDAIFLLQVPSGRLIDVNESACRQLRATRERLLASTIDDLIPAVAWQQIRSFSTHKQAMENGAETITTVLQKEDGETFPTEMTVQSVELEEDTYAIVVARDITERKKMEEQLRRQEQLAAIGQLAAGIAHDFRNLLSTVILYAQLSMRERDLPPSVAQKLQTIVDESYKATDLVQQILDFSSRAMIKTEPINLTALTADVLNVLSRTLPETIHLTLDVAGTAAGAYIAKVDPGRIQQALTNLALNARDAMPEGGALRFALSRMEKRPGKIPESDQASTEWLCLAVSDTGSGMTEEVQKHLFEPFFTTKEVGKGTGLGLAQVYGIVRQHDGYIDVTSAPGEGTTFTLCFPAYQEQIAPRESEAQAPIPVGQGETILLVEDEPRLRNAERAMLEALGYRVVTAKNGRDALVQCQTAGRLEEHCPRIDLVITDLVMPELGGEELLRELQKVRPTLPVLAVTGYALQKKDLDQMKEIGFVDVLAKPFDMEQLARVVKCVTALGT
jgi:two-component system, cell cycle sensor histidine kinase and response regulator CckA